MTTLPGLRRQKPGAISEGNEVVGLALLYLVKRRFACEPDQTLLGWHWQSRNDVYCIAQPGKEYGLFFTDGGMVTVDVSAVDGKELSVRWRWSLEQGLPQHSYHRVRLYLAAAGREITFLSTNAIRWSIDDFDPEFPVVHFAGSGGPTEFRIAWS